VKKASKFMAYMVVFMLLAGCAATFSQLMYREQATSLSSYKIINSTLTDLRAQGLITDQGWKQYSDLANAFLDKHKMVSLAMVKYSTDGGTSQAAVNLAQQAMQVALDALKAYYLKTVPADRQKPLF
jgi:hypothetical protein